MLNLPCSISAAYELFLRLRFSSAGLESTTTDLGGGTIMHCWVPKHLAESKPNLLLIHGCGANSLWQFSNIVGPIAQHFNLYVPDLLFFGGSRTTQPQRTESFQAQCVAAVVEAQGVKRMHVVGLSYGGFVAYSLAALLKEKVERVVLCCGPVSVEEKDVEEGLLDGKSVDELVGTLLPQTVANARDLLKLTFYRPPKGIPSFMLKDSIKYLYSDYYQERAELLYALFKNRKLVDLPKITQPNLCIWGEYDHLFPVELANRIKRHLGEKTQIVIVKNAGHALNVEQPKEVYKQFMSFLLGTENNYNKINGEKVE